MRRYLIVAHKTIGGEHLLERVRECLAAGPCHFHLLVPKSPTQSPTTTYSDGQLTAQAQARLDEAKAEFEALGADVSGEVGDENPVYAIDTVVRRAEREGISYDEILLSTLPQSVSRWIRFDVPRRVARQFSIPVTHLVAKPKKSKTKANQ